MHNNLLLSYFLKKSVTIQSKIKQRAECEKICYRHTPLGIWNRHLLSRELRWILSYDYLQWGEYARHRNQIVSKVRGCLEIWNRYKQLWFTVCEILEKNFGQLPIIWMTFGHVTYVSNFEMHLHKVHFSAKYMCICSYERSSWYRGLRNCGRRSTRP